MNVQEVVDRVNTWQTAENVHPLTCLNDSSHTALVPEVKDNVVVLVCKDCGYEQDFIPPVVLGLDM